MRLPRLLIVGVVAGLLGAPGAARAQGAPKLTKAQRAVLEAVVTAVDRAASGVEPTADASWDLHRLRASDGSHYVAFRALAPGIAPPPGPVVLYVRLATRGDGPSAVLAERSAVGEWLKGQRADPLPMRAGGSMSVPRGEMPVGNIIPGGRDVAAESFAALRLLMLEHEKTKRQREAQAAARRAEMERTGGRVSSMLPFEDFDVTARLAAGMHGGIDLRRSLAAGPGSYDVLVGWAAMPARNASPDVTVLSHRLTLPSAPPRFALSDIIVANQAAAIADPYPAAEQNAHPYATGMIEVTPAPGNVLAADESLSLVVQVVNPSGSPTGKPDVSVQFRIARLLGDREEPVGALPAQRYDAGRVPVDFDVAKGHPLFAATRASLATFARGRYRVTAVAQDHLADSSASADATFEVRGTPLSLLKEAPRAGRAFQRTALLTPTARQQIVRPLTPAAPSAALAGLLAAAHDGRFAELLRDHAVDPLERPTALLLRAFGLFALGDGPRSVAVPLSTALTAGAAEAPGLLLQGALQALAGNDVEAIAAWELARSRGVDEDTVAPLLVDAFLRRGDAGRATRLAEDLLARQPHHDAAARTMVALHLAAERYAEAVRRLDAAPLASATDEATRFLMLHALYGSLVAGAPEPDDVEARRARFASLADAYAAAGGAHAALVADWRAALAGR